MTEALVDVTFLEADSGRELGRATMPPKALPERMVPPRRLELKGISYAVVASQPASRAVAADLGRIQVRLRRVPEGAYTLPTLAEELPRQDPDRPRQGRLVELDSDEWTQLECFGAKAAPRVAEQLERIAVVRGERRDDGFYPRLQMRGQLGPLLKGVELTPDDVARVLPAGTLRLDGVLIEGEAGLVKDAFAFQTMNGLELYGLAPRGVVKVLALRAPAERSPLHEEAMGLSMLLLQHGLQVVDWVGGAIASQPAELEALLSS